VFAAQPEQWPDTLADLFVGRHQLSEVAQMPLQGSGVVGCCRLTTVYGEEEIPVSGPSHRSQCGG
jgi:hypothetical protein